MYVHFGDHKTVLHFMFMCFKLNYERKISLNKLHAM
jgi:hypothetical protein